LLNKLVVKIKPPKFNGRDPVYGYTNEPTDYTSLWKALETNPAPSTDNTTRNWGDKGETGYQLVEPGVDKSVTEEPLLTALPTAFSQKGWRTDLLNGTFDAGTWTFNCRLTGTKYTAVDLAIHVKIWKGSDPSGAGATLVQDWVASPTQHVADNAIVDYTWSVSLASLTVTSEYLFFEFCIQFVTASGDAAGATVCFTCDEDTFQNTTTPTFTPAVVTYTKTYSADALLKKSDIIKTYSADALLKAVLTKPYTADALLKKSDITKT